MLLNHCPPLHGHVDNGMYIPRKVIILKFNSWLSFQQLRRFMGIRSQCYLYRCCKFLSTRPLRVACPRVNRPKAHDTGDMAINSTRKLYTRKNPWNLTMTLSI